MTTNIRDPRSIVTPDAFSVSEELLGLPLASPRRRLAGILIDLVVVGFLVSVTRDPGFLIWGVIGVFLVRVAFRRADRQTARGQVTSVVFRSSIGCLGLFMLLIVAAVGVSEFIDDDSGGTPSTASRAGEPGSQTMEVETPESAGDPLPDMEMIADTLDRAGVLDALAALATAGDTVEPAPGLRVGRDEWAEAVEARAGQLFAADRLEDLEAEVMDAREEEAEARRELQDARAEARSGLGGLIALARDLIDELGSAFGIWTVYFTASLVLLRGRTVGKLVTRTRVLSLDGEPFTWWPALERSGGYAAGLATGLLGFFQIFWDRNRQCVHDKIVGSVVVMDGAEPIPDAWRQVWTDERSTPEAQPSEPPSHDITDSR